MQSSRRRLVILGSALAHAALLALLLRAPSAGPRRSDVGVLTVSLYDGKVLRTAQPPRRPTQPAPSRRSKPRPPPPEIEPQYIDFSPPQLEAADRDPQDDPVALSVAAAASAAAGRACQLTGWLQAALQADPQVQAALPLIPRPARSVANALMLWDGVWVDAPAGAAPGVAAIRSALAAGIRAAPAACQSQTIHGAELMTLADGSDTTVLAVGGAEWRWADLLADAPLFTTVGNAVPPGR